ncbi:MAG: site-2 protease family protein [Clostridia bacterium]|nr:site-2 protease family protein [Clostridia bacterium]
MNILATFPEFLTSVWSFTKAILVLLFMITVHEFGHYIAGKKLGFKIMEFSIGFGPAIYKRKLKSGEDFSLRAIPLGGYCAFLGEGEDLSTSEMSFDKQAPWKRIIVLIAGALMNFLTTIVIVVLTFGISGQYVFKVNKVLPNATGYESEIVLKEGDLILSANDVDIYTTTDLSTVLNKAKEDGKDFVNLEIVRNNERTEIKAPFRNYQSTGIDQNGNQITTTAYGLGFSPTTSLYKFGFFETLGRSLKYCFIMAGEVLSVIGQLFTGKIGLNMLSGPVSTITITAEVASLGIRQLLELITLIGVNLAVFNLLPIPALDGCKVLLTTIEWIRGKPVSKKVEGILDMAGFIFLIGFAILVDLIKVI